MEDGAEEVYAEGGSKQWESKWGGMYLPLLKNRRGMNKAIWMGGSVSKLIVALKQNSNAKQET